MVEEEVVAEVVIAMVTMAFAVLVKGRLCSWEAETQIREDG